MSPGCPLASWREEMWEAFLPKIKFCVTVLRGMSRSTLTIGPLVNGQGRREACHRMTPMTQLLWTQRPNPSQLSPGLMTRVWSGEAITSTSAIGLYVGTTSGWTTVGSGMCRGRETSVALIWLQIRWCQQSPIENTFPVCAHALVGKTGCWIFYLEHDFFCA